MFLICACRITFVFPQKTRKKRKENKKKERDEADSRPINAIFVVFGFQDPKTVREGDRERGEMGASLSSSEAPKEQTMHEFTVKVTSVNHSIKISSFFFFSDKILRTGVVFLEISASVSG